MILRFFDRISVFMGFPAVISWLVKFDFPPLYSLFSIYFVLELVLSEGFRCNTCFLAEKRVE